MTKAAVPKMTFWRPIISDEREFIYARKRKFSALHAVSFFDIDVKYHGMRVTLTARPSFDRE